MKGYDPFAYRPMLRYFYSGGPLPQNVMLATKADPGSIPYMQSTRAFTEWLKASYPTVHTALAQRAPAALDPVATVASGALTPGAARRVSDGTIRSRLGDLVSSQPVTEWGRTIADLSTSLLQLASQRDIIKMNISRAEQGLPPIDAGIVAPQVQVGMTPDTQKLAIAGMGGAVLLGVLALFMLKGKR